MHLTYIMQSLLLDFTKVFQELIFIYCIYILYILQRKQSELEKNMNEYIYITIKVYGYYILLFAQWMNWLMNNTQMRV